MVVVVVGCCISASSISISLGVLDVSLVPFFDSSAAAAAAPITAAVVAVVATDCRRLRKLELGIWIGGGRHLDLAPGVDPFPTELDLDSFDFFSSFFFSGPGCCCCCC